MFAQIAAGCLKQSTPKAEALKFRGDVQFEYFALERKRRHPVPAVGSVTRNRVIEIEDNET